MTNVENPRWIRYPEVSFKHQTIMMVNGQPIEIPDVPPGVLEDVIHESLQQINAQIESEYNWEIERNKNAIRPSIQIARLAIAGSEEKVLSSVGMIDMKMSNLHTSIYTIKKEYWPYWHEIRRTGYIPEVLTNVYSSADDTVSGTWLSVRRPEQ